MTTPVRVLIVDDDAMSRELTARVLSGRGYQTAQAEDGAVALRMLEREPAGLILLDMLMPNMEGVETLREIRARWPSTLVVAMSAGSARQASPSLLMMAKALGANATVEKSGGVDAIADTVDTVLSTAKQAVLDAGGVQTPSSSK